MDVHHPLVTLGSWTIESWTVLGRFPLAVVLLALAWWVARRAGCHRGALAFSGACAGIALGVAIVPSVLGAIAGMLLLGGLTLRATGVPAPGADRLAAGFLGVIGVGRLGCLLGGCCFGVPTQLPWGVTSAAGSTPARFHALLGLVEPGQASLHVHPVQAYEGLAALALLLALPGLTRLLRSGLAAALATAGGYLLVRAAIDPLRAMVNTGWSLVPAGPLSAFQWAALGAAVSCLAAALEASRRSRRGRAPHGDAQVVSAEPRATRLVMVLCVQAGAAWFGLPLLGPFLAALIIASLATSAALLVRLVLAGEAGRTPRRRLAAATLLALAVPVGLRATERSGDGASRAWVYAPMLPDQAGAGSGGALTGGSQAATDLPFPGPDDGAEPARLVRVGDQSTPESVLEERAASLAPGTTRRLYGHVAGSNMDYQVIHQGCGNDYLVRQAHRQYVEGGLAFESATRSSDPSGLESTSTWQLRGSVRGSSWNDQISQNAYVPPGTTVTMEPGGSGSGLRYTLGGMYQLDFSAVSIGLGGLVGHDGSHDPDGPAFTRSSGQVLYPGAYLRLGGRSFGVEGGTMALYQASEAPFAGLYFGPESVCRVRLGASLPYAGSELPSNFGLSLQIPVRSSVVQVGASLGSGAAGSLRIGFQLP
jgi:prolipoprotein diacylglyceryltransferase